jgi:cation transport regulator ChaC
MAWVFAYGSLMGDAVLGRFAARPARLAGYHREFAHESHRRWGSPEKPCPIVGLARGGECWGLAYAVPPEDEARIARSLARREAADERKRETQTVETPDGDVQAWVWVSSGSRRAEDPATLEARLRTAHGIVGNGTEYVRTLVQALDLFGLRDPLVDGLWARLRS